MVLLLPPNRSYISKKEPASVPARDGRGFFIVKLQERVIPGKQRPSVREYQGHWEQSVHIEKGWIGHLSDCLPVSSLQ